MADDDDGAVLPSVDGAAIRAIYAIRQNYLHRERANDCFYDCR